MSEQQIVIFGGCFNPPTNSHVAMAIALTKRFPKVMVVPCGERADKPSSLCLPLEQRRELVTLAFGGIEGVEIDFYDFDNKTMTTTFDLQHRYMDLYPEAVIWQAIGSDLLIGAYEHGSLIERTWYNGDELLRTCPFVVFQRAGFALGDEDYPTISLDAGNLPAGDSTSVRQLLEKGEAIKGLVPEKIEEYIRANRLYGHA